MPGVVVRVHRLHRSCPGRFRHIRLPSHGAGAGVGSPDVYLAGTDARLPPAESALGELNVVGEGEALRVSGWVGFAGATPDLLGTDPVGDTASSLPQSQDAGHDLTSAHLAQPDPETGDLHFELGLADSAPPFGSPAVRYLWDFGVRTEGGTRLFQIDGKLTKLADPTSGELRLPSFVLRGNCVEGGRTCEEVHQLTAWMDGHHDTIEVTVPRSVLEEQAGESLGAAELVPATVRSGIATVRSAGGAPEAVEDVLLVPQDFSYPVASPRVEIRLAPAGEPPTFTDTAELEEGGAFVTSLDISEYAAGDYDLYARACFGDTCVPSSRRRSGSHEARIAGSPHWPLAPVRRRWMRPSVSPPDIGAAVCLKPSWCPAEACWATPRMSMRG